VASQRFLAGKVNICSENRYIESVHEEKKLCSNVIYIISCQSLSVRLYVCPGFLPTYHQAISDLSIDLESLGEVKGFKTICRMIELEIKIFFSSTLFSILPTPT
jgi:hypothetical protein